MVVKASMDQRLNSVSDSYPTVWSQATSIKRELQINVHFVLGLVFDFFEVSSVKSLSASKGELLVGKKEAKMRAF